jgi:hypothetical protein
MSKYDPKDAIVHVVHDYVSLVLAGRGPVPPRQYPINHFAERTFLTHCRALADFYDPKKKQSRDLHANDFVKNPPFSADLPTWEAWADHIDKHLMHLTVGRIKNTIPWDGKPNESILREFEAAWEKFLGALKDDLKPLFDLEIQKQGKGVI